jgi:hypothetical protein
MDRSRRFGYLLCPLLIFAAMAASSLTLLAQSSSATEPSAQSESQPQAENPEADQIRLAQAAQARIRARRERRLQKIIEDTYSHKYEVYGGGGYLRFRPGPYLQHINESAWNAGFTDYLWGRLGLAGDLRGYYGTAYVGNNNDLFIFKPSITEYTFLGGPQYRVIRKARWAVSAQGLAGAAKGIFNANSAQLPGPYVGLWPSGTKFAAGAAVPVDYNLSPGLAVRLSPNYLLTTFGGDTQIKGLGFTAGVVIRFGRQSSARK